MYASTGLYKPRQGTAAQQYCPHAVLLGRGALSELLNYGTTSNGVNLTSKGMRCYERTVLEMPLNCLPSSHNPHPQISDEHM